MDATERRIHVIHASAIDPGWGKVMDSMCDLVESAERYNARRAAEPPPRVQ